MKEVLPPRNLQSIYNSYANLYADVMNQHRTIEQAETGERLLSGMLKVHLIAIREDELKLQLAETGHKIERVIENVKFRELPQTTDETK